MNTAIQHHTGILSFFQNDRIGSIDSDHRTSSSITREIVVLTVILITALLVRLTFLTGLCASDDFCYARYAADYLQGHFNFLFYYTQFTEGHTWNFVWRFLIWLPVALTFKVFGFTATGVVIYPLLCSLLTIILIWWIGRICISPTAGLSAALILALTPAAVKYATYLLIEPIGNFWYTLPVALIITALRYREQLHRPWRFILIGCAGIATGLAYYVRAYIILLLPVFGLLFIFDMLTKPNEKSTSSRNAGLFIQAIPWIMFPCGIAAAVLPFELWQYNLTGVFNLRWQVVQTMANGWASATSPDHMHELITYYSRLLSGSTMWQIFTITALFGVALLIIAAINKRVKQMNIVILLYVIGVFLCNEFMTSSLSHYQPLHKVERFAAVFAPIIALSAGSGLAIILPYASLLPAILYIGSAAVIMFFNTADPMPLSSSTMPIMNSTLTAVSSILLLLAIMYIIRKTIFKNNTALRWIHYGIAVLSTIILFQLMLTVTRRTVPVSNYAFHSFGNATRALCTKIPPDARIVYRPGIRWNTATQSYRSDVDWWENRILYYSGYTIPDDHCMPLYYRQKLSDIHDAYVLMDSSWISRRKELMELDMPDHFHLLESNWTGKVYYAHK